MIEQDVNGPTSHIYLSQRLRLHYVDWGNADAPPLILLHGVRDHCRSWDWVVQGLRKDFHIIAPDLRGHGDSQWSSDGNYSLPAHVYDLTQLIHQKNLAPVTIIGHSRGGIISLRYSGIFPENVAKLVTIEGLGYGPRIVAARDQKGVSQRIREWMTEQRGLSARHHHRYDSIEHAVARMQEANTRLTPAQARHLAVHGIRQNEDGSYSWKFDNYVHSVSPVDITDDELHRLWLDIACPVLVIYGNDSFTSNPGEDGRLAHFKNAKLATFENAGHWVHHDRLEAVMVEVKTFLYGQ